MDAFAWVEHAQHIQVLTGAIISTVAVFAFRLAIWIYTDADAKLARKGVDPPRWPDSRASIATSRASMWFFAALAVILWIRWLLVLLL